MAGKYQAYPEYAHSGVNILGAIPIHWSTNKVNYLFTFGRGLNITKADLEDTGISCVSYGEVHSKYGFEVDPDRHSLKCVQSSYLSASPRSLLSPGDFVFADTSEDIDGAGNFTQFVGEGLLFAGYHTVILRPKGRHVPRYLAYAFDTAESRNQIRFAVKGVKVFSITQEILKNVFLALPTHSEQRTIAAFLDHETARIDRLIEKQQRLIELLKEKRQAVISHAVTKGLDPNVPMKDSGVEWLGQVPEHWVVCRLKHVKHPRANSFVDGPFGSNLKSEHFISEGDVYVIESNFATTGLLMPSKLKTISEDHFLTIKRSEAEEGDIIIAKIGARYGSSAILPSIDKKAVVSGNSLKLTINKEICLVEYANLLLRHLKNEEAMDDGVNVTAQPALSLGALNNLPFLAPPLDEQSKILSYIDQTSELFDKIISKSELSIQLSGERRTALISAAVTGKIDVRNWQPNTSTQTAEPDLPMAAEQAAEYRV